MKNKFRYIFRKKGALKRFSPNPRIRSVGKTEGGGFRDGSKNCEICGKTTREGKPFCPEHIAQHPYVQELLGYIEDKDIEQERIRAAEVADALENSQTDDEEDDIVDREGITTKDILMHLKMNGSRTVERLAREFSLDVAVALHYVKYLKREGLVKLGKTRRGGTVVSLVNKESRYRRNAEDRPLLPRRYGPFEVDPLARGTETYKLAQISKIKAVIQEIADNPPEGSLVPSCPMVGEIPFGQSLKPRATFDLMLSGRFPLIRVREGQAWRVEPEVIKSTSNLLVRSIAGRVGGIGDARAWYDLFAVCVTGELHVMKDGERYIVIDVSVDYTEEEGPSPGEMLVQHLGRGSRGGRREHWDIQDNYGKILPFITYKNISRRNFRRRFI